MLQNHAAAFLTHERKDIQPGWRHSYLSSVIWVGSKLVSNTRIQRYHRLPCNACQNDCYGRVSILHVCSDELNFSWFGKCAYSTQERVPDPLARALFCGCVGATPKLYHFHIWSKPVNVAIKKGTLSKGRGCVIDFHKVPCSTRWENTNCISHYCRPDFSKVDALHFGSRHVA
jgi:hypothetical protein